MELIQLLGELQYTCLQGDVHNSVTELLYDSRKQGKQGSVFVCISGTVYDGHEYIKDMVDKGVTSVIIEKEVDYPKGITVIRVSNAREALAHMSAAYFGHPAKKLTTIGITGTKGKTTTSYMVRSILENVGIKTGLIGTNEILTGEEVISSSHSTPESYLIQLYLSKMVEAGCQCVVMEASSQGLMMHRLDGFTFDYGIFTNLGSDHIGGFEHKDFEEYMSSKSKLFRQCRVGLINIDDHHAADILRGHTCEVETFGMSEQAQMRADEYRLLDIPGRLGVSYRISGAMDMEVEVEIPGKFNVYNSLCAIAICRHFHVPEDRIQEAIRNVRVRGRVELVPVSDQYTVMLDYAHNAMSLESLLTTLREYQPKRLVCVFGCGGNRSRERRFEMGELSSKMADLTIVTSDNPRFEEPADIIKDIITGVQKGPGEYIEIIDRGEAIRYSIQNARPGDLIVIAGKGHEDYQEIRGVKYHMDDRELIKNAVDTQ